MTLVDTMMKRLARISSLVFISLIASGLTCACIAQEEEESISASRETAITRAVELVAPAIVGINVTEVREVRGVDPWSMFERDPFFRDFMSRFPRRSPRTYRQELHGLGSGFLISMDGYIVTNDHVAGTATEVIVTTTDGKEHEAQIVGSDRASDITLLKIDGSGFPYLNVGNSDEVIVGEWAIALGNPFGLFDINAKPTVTVGVVSNTDVNLRPQENRVYVGMIQTDAAISSGNSGGPLVNALGEVVGMNTIIYSTSTSNQGSGSIGIGFAVPINRVMGIVRELREQGSIDRNFWTGMSVRTVDEEIARYLELESVTGAVIIEIVQRSPASTAGLSAGDVIVGINDAQVRTEEDLELVVYDSRVNDEIELELIRGGELIRRNLRLESRR